MTAKGAAERRVLPVSQRRHGSFLRPILNTAIACAFLLGCNAAAQDGTIVSQFPNPPRLRALDFSAFEAALASYPEADRQALTTLLRTATVVDLQAEMAAGRLTSEALTLYFLERIQRYDETLRSYIEVNPAALDEARAVDAARAEGKNLGPLMGIPLSIKDNIETAPPMHTTGGAEILLDNIATADAPLVAQLRASGAVILGKANLSELAGAVSMGVIFGGSTAVGGQGQNPYGLFPTGGSSSGSAQATTTLLAVASVGTETSGSLIAPSAWNGVAGMKPSRGVVSGQGVIPLVSNNDSPGPIARSVTDAAALLGVIDDVDVDYLAQLDSSALKDVAVGVLEADILAQPENEDILARVKHGLTEAGATLSVATLAADPGVTAAFSAAVPGGFRFETVPYIAARFPEIVTTEDLMAYNLADPDRRMPFGQAVLDFGAPATKDMTPEGYAAAIETAASGFTAALEQAFAEHRVEMLVSLENIHSTYYATAGFPAATVPLGLRVSGGFVQQVGLNSAGMPAGVTFIGRKGEDARLLAYAFAFEQATKLAVRPDWVE